MLLVFTILSHSLKCVEFSQFLSKFYKSDLFLPVKPIFTILSHFHKCDQLLTFWCDAFYRFKSFKFYELECAVFFFLFSATFTSVSMDNAVSHLSFSVLFTSATRYYHLHAVSFKSAPRFYHFQSFLRKQRVCIVFSHLY